MPTWEEVHPSSFVYDIEGNYIQRVCRNADNMITGQDPVIYKTIWGEKTFQQHPKLKMLYEADVHFNVYENYVVVLYSIC